MDNSNLHSDEAEVNVIASILVIQDNSKYINSLETQDFYSKTNKAIFSLMKELNDKDETVDLLTVKELGVTKKFNGIKLLETMTDMTDKLPEAVQDNAVGQIPLKKMGRPEDVAQAVLFLAGNTSDYITGQVLCVDGGMAM